MLREEPCVPMQPSVNMTMLVTTASRPLNSSFQLALTNNAFVIYSVEMSATLTIIGGQSNTVYLETSPDNSIWTEAGQSVNTNSGTLTVGLNLTQVSTATLCCMVPKGYWVRLRTTGTGTVTYRSGQETLI